jgi:hypothetical protein
LAIHFEFIIGYSTANSVLLFLFNQYSIDFCFCYFFNQLIDLDLLVQQFINFIQKLQSMERIRIDHFDFKKKASSSYFGHYDQELFLLPQNID